VGRGLRGRQLLSLVWRREAAASILSRRARAKDPAMAYAIHRYARQSVGDPDWPVSRAAFPGYAAVRRPLGVLVVEDDPLLRWAIAETLRLAGHRVIEAWDVVSAEHGFRNAVDAIDIVLFDGDLQDLPQTDLLAVVRALAPGRVIVMMTDDASPAATTEAEGFGVHAVVGKPFEMGSIEQVLRNACRASRGEPLIVRTNQPV
jgi:CheY-like chemotaxis protein